jgi:hypothetical protein
MRLDKLQLDLHPRTNAQALDLGFVLLRMRIGHVYAAWLALWLPLSALAAALAILLPEAGGMWWWLLAWWLRPLIERAPLFILSRQVFGEEVTWRDALRAWPGQLRGGWFRLLTWWRLFQPGRGLYQAIWQLEGARGAVAAERRKVIGRNGSGRSAYWFGIVCAHFEVILQIGFIAFIGIFLASENSMNPFAYLFAGGKPVPATMQAVSFAGYTLAAAVIGPIYTACCFTLYLNRRATLEAWDIEIVLRQIRPPAGRQRAATATWLVAPLLGLLTALACLQPTAVEAADVKASRASCEPPAWIAERNEKQRASRGPDRDDAQTKIRREVSELYDSDDLRGYVCEEMWQLKNKLKPTPETQSAPLPNLGWLARLLKIAAIAALVGAAGWLLYRYRGNFPDLVPSRTPRRATEIRGLDIRPESLPDDVVAEVGRLWQQGERRAALALLYRATLSRLVHEDGLAVTRGATEGDCLRIARRAHADGRLPSTRLDAVENATDLWLNGAWGGRWPADDAVTAHCARWHAEFGQRSAGSAA